MVRCLVSSVYGYQGVNENTVSTWCQRYARDVSEHPDRVRLVFAPEIKDAPDGKPLLNALGGVSHQTLHSWLEATRLLTRAEKPPRSPSGPIFYSLVEDSIALPEASLVIFRDRTLVELTTDELGSLAKDSRGGQHSWQIGATDRHHCHLGEVKWLRMVDPLPPWE